MSDKVIGRNTTKYWKMFAVPLQTKSFNTMLHIHEKLLGLSLFIFNSDAGLRSQILNLTLLKY